jgi:two-component system, LytTR family, response regulator
MQLKFFEVNTLNYFLKPVDPDRLENSMQRLKADETYTPDNLKYKYNDVIFITFNSKRKFIKISDIPVINSVGDYTEIKISDGQKSITNNSMKEWETKLPENCFCRIHRSAIINIEQVDKLEEWSNNTYRVFIRGLMKPCIMRRRYALKIRNKLK